MDIKFNVQLALQMLTFFLVGLVASIAYEDEEQVNQLNRHYLLALVGIGALWAFFNLGPGRHIQGQTEGHYLGFADRPAAMSLIVIAAIFLAQFRTRPLLATLVWAACLSIAVLSGSRMVTMVVLVLWLVHPRLASIRIRLATVGIMMLAGIVAFNTPIIQDRFFQKESGFSGKGSISDVAAGKFDSAGRFDSWPTIIEKSQERFWLGHGVGESAPYVYKIWAPMDKPHNEYIKMLFDGGVIGLVTFVFALLWTMWNLMRINRSASFGANWPASAAYMSTAGFIMMAIFDNPLVCGVNYLHPTFALIGAANGIAAKQARNGLEARNDESESSDSRFRRLDPLPELIPLR